MSEGAELTQWQGLCQQEGALALVPSAKGLALRWFRVLGLTPAWRTDSCKGGERRGAGYKTSMGSRKEGTRSCPRARASGVAEGVNRL